MRILNCKPSAYKLPLKYPFFETSTSKMTCTFIKYNSKAWRVVVSSCQHHWLKCSHISFYVVYMSMCKKFGILSHKNYNLPFLVLHEPFLSRVKKLYTIFFWCKKHKWSMANFCHFQITMKLMPMRMDLFFSEKYYIRSRCLSLVSGLFSLSHIWNAKAY
jgi:hypothetical protein